MFADRVRTTRFSFVALHFGQIFCEHSLYKGVPQRCWSILRTKTRREREERERERGRGRVQVAPIEATACGIVPGLRSLELQTNAITPHPVPLYAAQRSCPRWTRIHRSTIEPPISMSPTRFNRDLALFMLETFPSWEVCGSEILA